VNLATVGVVGRVASTAAHRDDGSRSTLSHVVVELDVEDWLFGTGTERLSYVHALPPTPDSFVEGLPDGVAAGDRFGPQLAEGDRVVVLLAERTIGTRRGPASVLGTAGGYQSTWILADGIASSVDPQRSVSEAALVSRIVEERDTGLLTDDSSVQLINRDLKTRRNPLGAEDVPPITSPDLPPESGSLPTLVDDPTVLTIQAPEPLSNVTAKFGPSTSGGVIVGIYLDGALAASQGGPSLTALEGSAVAAVTPDGAHLVLAVFGQAGTATEAAVAHDSAGDEVALTAAMWPEEGRVALLLVVPIGDVDFVKVDGLRDSEPFIYSLPRDPFAFIPDE